MRIKTQKTYTMTIVVSEEESIFEYLKAYEDNKSVTSPIFDWIEVNLTPLVPYKKTSGFGYRQYMNHEKSITMTVTFYVAPSHNEYI